jgi:uncharacterized protein YggE
VTEQREPTVTVRGEAVVPGRPDEIVVALELSAIRETPEAAYDDVAGRSAELEALFGELEIAPAGRSTTGVSNRVSVRVADPALVSRLLREAVARAEAGVKGPGWRVAPDNPARIEACRGAAAVARLKAEAYADALGVRLGRVVEAREPLVTPGPVPRGVMLAAVQQEDIPIDPGELDVFATVDVTFALEQP